MARRAGMGGFQDLPEKKYPRSYTPAMRQHLESINARETYGYHSDVEGGEKSLYRNRPDRDMQETIQKKRKKKGL